MPLVQGGRPRTTGAHATWRRDDRASAPGQMLDRRSSVAAVRGPDVGRDLPVGADLAPNEHVLATDRRAAGGSRCTPIGADLACHILAEPNDVHGGELNVLEVFGRSCPKARCRRSPLMSSGPGGNRSTSSVKKRPTPGAPSWFSTAAYSWFIRCIVSTSDMPSTSLSQCYPPGAVSEGNANRAIAATESNTNYTPFRRRSPASRKLPNAGHGRVAQSARCEPGVPCRAPAQRCDLR